MLGFAFALVVVARWLGLKEHCFTTVCHKIRNYFPLHHFSIFFYGSSYQPFSLLLCCDITSAFVKLLLQLFFKLKNRLYGSVNISVSVQKLSKERWNQPLKHVECFSSSYVSSISSSSSVSLSSFSQKTAHEPTLQKLGVCNFWAM